MEPAGLHMRSWFLFTKLCKQKISPLSQRQNIMILKPGSSIQINYLIPFVLIILITIKIGFVLNDYILHIKNFELYLAYYKS